MLQIRFLGQFDVRVEGKPLAIPTRAAQSLFAFLVLNAGTPHRREKLAGLLWPDTPDENARRSLRQELWRLRKALAAHSTDEANALSADELTVTFLPRADFWFDVQELEQPFASDAPLTERINRVAVFQGELLPGFYEDWVLLERERVQALYETQMRALLEELRAGHHWQSAVNWAEKWIAFGQTPEAAYRALMLTYAMLGDRAQAAAAYERCKIALEKDLGVEPSPETQALYDELMRGDTNASVDLNARRVLVSKNALYDAPPAPGEPPFKGLEFFDEADARLFYGREQVVETLAQSIRAQNFLAVIVGASGSGKSSVVRAGLIPAIRRDVPAGKDVSPKRLYEWHIFVMTPTAHPLEALAVTLTRDSESLTATATLLDDLARDPRALQLWLTRKMQDWRLETRTQSPVSSLRAVLVVDQFEELFTLCRDDFEREQFIDNLLDALRVEQGAGASRSQVLTLVLTIRADFYAHLAQYPELREVVSKHQEYIGAMNVEELRSAMEEPARQAGWEFEPGLVDLMLRDVGDEPGALPLLSHALLETWKRRAGRVMTLKGYHEAGGVRGAIAQTAETTYGQLNVEQQKIARNIFVRLTELGNGTEDTRRRAGIRELETGDWETTRAVLTKLADARLVTTHENSAQVAHEALIREWPRLREWLNEDREGLMLHRHLTEAANEWALMERDASALYRGARLAQAREWAAMNSDRMNELERAFLDASEEQEKKETREREEQRERELVAAQKLAETQTRAAKQLRRRALYLAGAFVLALLLAVIAVFLGDRANQNAQAAATARDEAQFQERVANARALASNSLNNLGIDPQLSILLALQAVKATEPDGTVLPEVQDALHRAVTASHIQGVLQVEPPTNDPRPATVYQNYRAAYSPDGSQIATRALGAFKIWDARTRRELFNLPVSADFGAIGLAFNADGSQVATIDHDKQTDSKDTLVNVFDIHSGKLLRQARLSQPWMDVFGVGFSPDLTRVVLMPFGEAPVRVWDTTTSEALATLPIVAGNDLFPSVAFSPDGTRVVTGVANTAAKIFDAATGKEMTTLCCHVDTIARAVFSPDGTRVATGSWDAKIKIWDVETGKELTTLVGHSAVPIDLVWSPDGKRLASASWDRKAIVWDVEQGKQIYELPGHLDSVTDADFSPDGKALLTVSNDRSARIWDVGPSREVIAIDGAPKLYLSGHNAKRTHIYTTRSQGTTGSNKSQAILEIWDAETLQPRVKLSDLNFERELAISPDETLAAFIAPDHSIRVWALQSDKQIHSLMIEGDVFMWGPRFSRDGRRIAAPYNTDIFNLTIWDTKSGKPITTFPVGTPENNYIVRASWSPDNSRFVTGVSDGKTQVWDANNGTHLFDLLGHTDLIDAIAYSPDGSMIATASRDGTTIVYQADNGKELYRLVGHSSEVFGLDFSPEGKYLVTSSGDGTAKVWDASNGKELLSLYHSPDVVSGAMFTADGKHILTTSEDGAIREYTLDVNELVELAKARLIRMWRQDECVKFLHMEQCPSVK